MRTNVVIDDRLMEQALQLSGLHTKKDVIEAGLKLLVRLSAQERVKKYRGRLLWEGDLDASRREA
jgi:Arc/MetJ family transcription regulator